MKGDTIGGLYYAILPLLALVVGTLIELPSDTSGTAKTDLELSIPLKGDLETEAKSDRLHETVSQLPDLDAEAANVIAAASISPLRIDSYTLVCVGRITTLDIATSIASVETDSSRFSVAYGKITSAGTCGPAQGIYVDETPIDSITTSYGPILVYRMLPCDACAPSDNDEENSFAVMIPIPIQDNIFRCQTAEFLASGKRCYADT